MEGERPSPTRRKRIDGTILFGGVLSALLHAIGIALLLTVPTRLQPIEETAYTVEVVDPDALGGELLAGPIGAAASGGRDEPEPAPPPPKPAKPELLAKAEPAVPPKPEAEAVLLEPARPTPRATPAARVTARPKPKPTVTKIAKAARSTPVRKPTAKKTAAPAPKPVAKKTAAPAPKPVAVAKKPTTPPKPAVQPVERAGADRGADGDLDSKLSAAIAGLEGQRRPGSGLGGTDESQTGPSGVGGEGPGGGGKVRGLEFVAYYTQMLARIKDRWTWAGDGADRQVTVRFSILPSGDIANLRLVERSGDATYDASVQRAIKGASPFAPPPEAYQRDFADVELTFRPADLEVSG